VLSAAIAAYELTSQPALAVVTVGLKVGWGRFSVAVWLLWRDPVRSRGWAGFWLYLGSGFWLAALVGCFLCFTIPLTLQNAAAGAIVRNVPIMDAFVGAAGTLVAGLYLAAGGFLAAGCIARRNGFRLWLNTDLVLARERGEWPPARYGSENQIRFPVLVSVFFVVMTGGTAATVAAGAAIGAIGLPGKPVLWLLSAVWILGLPTLGLRVCDRLRRDTFARVAWEFWPDVPPAAS
jgi:hypothetical protein